jgi:hypothetical protein
MESDSASIGMSGLTKKGGNGDVLPPKNPTSMGGNSATYGSTKIGGGRKGSRAMKMKMAKLRAMRKKGGNCTGKNYGGSDKFKGGRTRGGNGPGKYTDPEENSMSMSGGAIESTDLDKAYGSSVGAGKMHMSAPHTNSHSMKGGRKRRSRGGSRKGSRKGSRTGLSKYFPF